MLSVMIDMCWSSVSVLDMRAHGQVGPRSGNPNNALSINYKNKLGKKIALRSIVGWGWVG